MIFLCVVCLVNTLSLKKKFKKKFFFKKNSYELKVRKLQPFKVKKVKNSKKQTIEHYKG